MKTILKTLVSLCLTLFLTAAMGNAVKADLSVDLSQAFNKGRIEDLAGLYTSDAVVMPPSSEILTGNAAIEQYWNGLRAAGFGEYNIYNVELRISGDTAYQTGLWQATRKDAAGNVIRLEGNISNVLTRQKSGDWKIRLQSWN